MFAHHGEGRLGGVFGRRREVAELRARLEVLERRIRTAEGADVAARALLEDAGRLENLAARAVACRAAAEAAVEGMRSGAAGTVPDRPRFRPTVNTVYRAETVGYVSLSMRYGASADRLRLMVGPEDPPAECVCEVTTDLWYGTGIVRPGEYWTVASRRVRDDGFGCLFTPLF